MKTYEKPVLNALSLSANSLLCACAYDVVEPSENEGLIAILKKFNSDPTKLFSNSTEDAGFCEQQICFEGYCKNTPSADMQVFNS